MPAMTEAALIGALSAYVHRTHGRQPNLLICHPVDLRQMLGARAGPPFRSEAWKDGAWFLGMRIAYRQIPGEFYVCRDTDRPLFEGERVLLDRLEELGFGLDPLENLPSEFAAADQELGCRLAVVAAHSGDRDALRLAHALGLRMPWRTSAGWNQVWGHFRVVQDYGRKARAEHAGPFTSAAPDTPSGVPATAVLEPAYLPDQDVVRYHWSWAVNVALRGAAGEQRAGAR